MRDGGDSVFLAGGVVERTETMNIISKLTRPILRNIMTNESQPIQNLLTSSSH